MNSSDGLILDSLAMEYRLECLRAPEELLEKWRVTLGKRVRASEKELEKKVDKGDFHLYVLTEDINNPGSLKRAFDFEPSHISRRVKPGEEVSWLKVDSNPSNVTRLVQPEEEGTLPLHADFDSATIAVPVSPEEASPREVDIEPSMSTWRLQVDPTPPNLHILPFGGDPNSSEYDTLVATWNEEVPYELQTHGFRTVRLANYPKEKKVEVRTLEAGSAQESLVAVCNITEGELIIGERPMLVVDSSIDHKGTVKVDEQVRERRPDLRERITEMVRTSGEPKLQPFNPVAGGTLRWFFPIPIPVAGGHHWVDMRGVYDIISRGCLPLVESKNVEHNAGYRIW